MWDEKVCLEKLTEAKELLEATITGTNSSHCSANGNGTESTESTTGVAWKSEWQIAIRKWSSGITLHTNDGKRVTVRFPCSSPQIEKFEAVTTSGVEHSLCSTWLNYYFENGSVTDFNLTDQVLMHYRKHADLEIVPPNILSWCICFFVSQLDGQTKHKFSARPPHALCDNWLFIKEQHRFPDSETFLETIDQGWVKVGMKEYATILELPSSVYLRYLLASFNAHLITRIIGNCFMWRTKTLSDNACHFVSALSEEPGREVRIYCPSQPRSCVILERIGDTSLQNKLDFKITAVTAVTPIDAKNSCWNLSLREKWLTDLVGNLDSTDVDFILHTFVEVNHHIDKLKDSITEQFKKDPEFKFPTANDYFQSFDLLLLRGTLAEIIPAVRLVAYEENVAALRQDAAISTSPVPAAVVDLIGSYLPPLLP